MANTQTGWRAQCSPSHALLTPLKRWVRGAASSVIKDFSRHSDGDFRLPWIWGYHQLFFFYRWTIEQNTWSVGSTDFQKGTHQAFSGLGFWHAWNNNWDCRPHYPRTNVPHPLLSQVSEKSARLLVRSGSWFPLLEQGKQGSLQPMIEGITEERWGSNSAKGKKDMPNHNKSKTPVFLCKQAQGNGFVWQGKMWAEKGNWVRSQRNYKKQRMCDQEYVRAKVGKLFL